MNSKTTEVEIKILTLIYKHTLCIILRVLFTPYYIHLYNMHGNNYLLFLLLYTFFKHQQQWHVLTPTMNQQNNRYLIISPLIFFSTWKNIKQKNMSIWVKVVNTKFYERLAYVGLIFAWYRDKNFCAKMYPE